VHFESTSVGHAGVLGTSASKIDRNRRRVDAENAEPSQGHPHRPATIAASDLEASTLAGQQVLDGRKRPGRADLIWLRDTDLAPPIVP